MRECLVIYVDAALDKNGRAGCGLAVFVRGRAVYTESFGVRDRIRRGHRVVRYVSRKANPAHELAREGLKKLVRQGVPVAA